RFLLASRARLKRHVHSWFKQFSKCFCEICLCLDRIDLLSLAHVYVISIEYEVVKLPFFCSQGSSKLFNGVQNLCHDPVMEKAAVRVEFCGPQRFSQVRQGGGIAVSNKKRCPQFRFFL